MTIQYFPTNKQGSLTLVKGNPLITISYLTKWPVANNWIGLWFEGVGGPVDQRSHSPSLVWNYTPDAEGTLHIDTSRLEPGRYTAFFLATDGYKWLTEPLGVVLPREIKGSTSFIATHVRLPNARQGDYYSQSIGGFVRGGSDPLTFSISGAGPGWLAIGSDGVLSGTPDGDADDAGDAGDAGDAVVAVKATDSHGISATADFVIRVRPAGSRLLLTLQVLSWNMWNGGTGVDNYHEKQVRFIATSGADIVGLQEDQSGRHVPRLAKALGWYYWASGGDTSIISKYPIAEVYGAVSPPDRVIGVRIALDGEDQQVNLYDAHLGYSPYGPYDFCYDHMSKHKVLEREAQSGRTPQMHQAMAAMEHHLERADQIPVIFVGDMNAPSHLDWVEELKEKNGGVCNVPWPTSVLPEQHGLVDSFRLLNPDPVKSPGITWSPITPWNWGYRLPEPQDRIDFIYHKGRALRPLESRCVVVGEPKPHPDYRHNEWTSDHAAVITHYELV